MPQFDPALIEVMKKVLEDTMTRVPSEQEMSRSLLNYVGPTLPGMNVTRPS